MIGQWWDDDDALLAALEDALESADPIPREFFEAGRLAYAWHDIDAELAALTYDSAAEEERLPALTRGEPAGLRSLTFAAADVTIEIEVTHDALIGQVVPPQPGELEVRGVSRRVATVPIDELGCFVVRPIPSGSFRLHCHMAGDTGVLTGWITL